MIYLGSQKVYDKICKYNQIRLVLMNRIIGIVLLTALNVITSFVSIGALYLIFSVYDFSFGKILDVGSGLTIFIIIFSLIEIYKWFIYILILIIRHEKSRFHLIFYGLMLICIALFFQTVILAIMGVLYFLVIFLLKEKKITVKNDFLLFDEASEVATVDNDTTDKRDTPFIIGLTLLVIVAVYVSWTTLESAFIVIRYSLNLGVIPLLHLILDIVLALFCWVSLYKVIKDRQSNWKYYFAGLFMVNTIVLILRTIELSKLEYFTSVFMMLDPVKIFMMGFNIIGFLLLIRKRQEIREEVDL